jgi:hypothetical protein
MSAQKTTTTAEALHAGYVQRAGDWRRDHLGASVIGHQCDRYLWLSFRWALDRGNDGKLLRLFERGQREEAWIIDDLRAIGCEVVDRDPVTGDQFRMRDGHVAGSIDGIVSQLREADGPHLLEVKTSNAKQFAKMKLEKVKRAKPDHYAQMQTYMHFMGLPAACYVAVCKDNDEIYTEIVKADAAYASKVIDRAKAITVRPDAPERMDKDFAPCILVSKDGTRWPCQFYELCHSSSPVMAEKSCRTCLDSVPSSDGKWHCKLHEKDLSSHDQRVGCNQQLIQPDIMNMSTVEVGSRSITYQAQNGQQVTDGRK